MGQREAGHAAELAGEADQWLAESDEEAVLRSIQQAAFNRRIDDRVLSGQADRIGLRNEFAIQNGVNRRAVGVRMADHSKENKKKTDISDDGHFRAEDEIKV